MNGGGEGGAAGEGDRDSEAGSLLSTEAAVGLYLTTRRSQLEWKPKVPVPPTAPPGTLGKELLVPASI